jgi:hypothetical protein
MVAMMCHMFGTVVADSVGTENQPFCREVIVIRQDMPMQACMLSSRRSPNGRLTRFTRARTGKSPVSSASREAITGPRNESKFVGPLLSVKRDRETGLLNETGLGSRPLNRAQSALRSDNRSMLRAGKYAAWFRTVVLAPDGTLTGGDTIMSYTGRWQTEGEQFEASLIAVRHSPGAGAFGEASDLDLTLTGRSKGDTASCTGTARQVPGLTLEATLVRMAND